MRKQEQKAISYLVQHIPHWISSNMLTGFGLFGSIIVGASFVLAGFFHKNYLLLGILGFTISWFGDSLDGRIAYFRNTPRKNYGFALDITIDWISIILIGLGFIIYAKGPFDLLGYGFVVMYGWEMIIALLKYRITGHYSIDSGIFGPTEVRIIVTAIMVAEVLLPGSIIYSTIPVCLLLFVFNILDTRKLLRIADKIDRNKSGD
ncbi:MAG: CDP-alcohol phosphatidyltransferase family protein [Bacteroidales bacterium]|nr:CDP-alcohol phosphatidyltransferase family protein [Bacteroidales bacterium]MBN2697655.1 CDP-alcohol phosphatidyltransferase family protein [Bacteroidales bacterium]